MEKVQPWMHVTQGPPNVLPATPPGLEALYSQCRRIYPNQTNPLQVSAFIKCWLGGPDPLDYISMYANTGNAEENIPPHWHYISFGLSDLHGDGRVHEVKSKDEPSGFGFELTFRLKREPGETAPPTWPASLMQALAKYVFQSGNLLCAGDHVSWHCALDNSESRIQHMLMTTDPQLGAVETPLGTVDFIQIVGVCEEELRCAQRWNGPGVIEILKRLPGTGGSWLVSDMRRGESMLDLEITIQEEVERGIENEGSNLSGVSACCSWVETDTDTLHNEQKASKNWAHVRNMFLTCAQCPDFISDFFKEDCEPVEVAENASRKQESRDRDADNNPAFHVSDEERMRIKAELFKGLRSSHIVPNPSLANNPSRQFEDETNQSKTVFGLSANTSREPAELSRLKCLDGVHLTFNLESGLLLPLAIRGRVMHGRHFTFKSVLGDTAVTLVSPSVTGILVDFERPYVAQGSWLQMLIPDELAEDMSNSLEVFNNVDDLKLPKTLVWKNHKLAITILPDGKSTAAS